MSLPERPETEADATAVTACEPPAPTEEEIAEEAALEAPDLLLNREQAEEALPFCSRAVQADPTSAPAHYRFGLALERLGRSAESVKHYEQAIRLAPDASAARSALDRVRNTD